MASNGTIAVMPSDDKSPTRSPTRRRTRSPIRWRNRKAQPTQRWGYGTSPTQIAGSLSFADDCPQAQGAAGAADPPTQPNDVPNMETIEDRKKRLLTSLIQNWPANMLNRGALLHDTRWREPGGSDELAPHQAKNERNRSRTRSPSRRSTFKDSIEPTETEVQPCNPQTRSTGITDTDRSEETESPIEDEKKQSKRSPLLRRRPQTSPGATNTRKGKIGK